ncbi:MAG: hypothetical protein V4603_13405, partial [Pseudomonadota bacterium]
MSLFKPTIFHHRAVVGSLLILALAGCQGPYTYTFNDNVIFSPNDSRDEVTNVLQDADLQGCLNQFLAGNNGQTALTDIKLLACPGIGVETLSG